ncbi:phage tail tip fiber protein [Kushneria phosphatilytica]|uniref:Host specificity protein J n=1 Tax=Kushneria phosphatilytica TaxID=657387 RepID=A0A1S1NVX5_9GAMM|nr:phage tail protein [Kushneria phosphatilytica]OHV12111.1 hypothetical protein BH688_05520 [Kushneria phosphatilytica]QEL11307.1 host specificity protein J [Kushneria phosphatilytica]
MGDAVEAVASVAVGVAVGFATGNPYFGITAAATIYSATSKGQKPNANTNQGDVKQTVRSSKEPVRWVFGDIGVGGLLFWAQEQTGDQDRDDEEKLYLVYAVTEGHIDGIRTVYANQEDANDSDGLIEWDVVSDPDEVNQYLLNNSPDWRESQIGKGLTYVRLTLTYDSDYFASGIPDFKFAGRFNDELYDPRDESTGYSDNPALIMLWYLRNRLNVPDDEIVFDMFSEAANICDESVTNPDGGVDKRYAMAGGFKADERKDEVISDIEATCAGNLVRIGGRFGFMAGAYYGPAEFTITEDMVIGQVQGSTEVSRSDAVNTIRGTFVDPAQRWTETDYPSVQVDEWVEQDGEEIEDTLNLRFVTNAYQAQRLANIQLRKKRAGGNLKLKLNFAGYACRPGRVVRVSLPTLDIDGEFAVSDWEFSGTEGCQVTLSAVSADIFDDSVAQPYSPPDFIDMPTGGMAAPANVRYLVKRIGDVQQGRITWNAVPGALHYNVVIRHDGSAVQSAQVPGGVTNLSVSGLTAGSYTVGVSARGSLATSGEGVATFDILQPPKPDRVVVTEARDSIMLIPTLNSGDLGGGTWEYYWSTISDISNAEVTERAEYLSQGASVTHSGRTPGQTYYYWVRGVNAYGKSEWFTTQATTNENFDDIFDALRNEIEQEGQLYDDIVEGVSPGVLQQVDTDLDGFRQQLENNEKAISELRRGSDEQAVKMLLLKAASETNNSTLRVEQIVRSNLARQVTTLQTAQAQVEDDLYTVVQEDGNGFKAGAIRTVQVGDSKAVLGLKTDGDIAEIGAVADKFYIYNEVSGEHVLAFIVEDGRVVMPESLIGQLTAGKIVTDDGRSLIENGYIRTDVLDVQEVARFTGDVESNNYSQGSRGWKIEQNGTVEFYDATVRGTLFADDIKGDVATFTSFNWSGRSNNWTFYSHNQYLGDRDGGYTPIVIVTLKFDWDIKDGTIPIRTFVNIVLSGGGETYTFPYDIFSFGSISLALPAKTNSLELTVQKTSDTDQNFDSLYLTSVNANVVKIP